jgi:hypothetical protein
VNCRMGGNLHPLPIGAIKSVAISPLQYRAVCFRNLNRFLNGIGTIFQLWSLDTVEAVDELFEPLQTFQSHFIVRLSLFGVFGPKYSEIAEIRRE